MCAIANAIRLQTFLDDERAELRRRRRLDGRFVACGRLFGGTLNLRAAGEGAREEALELILQVG